MLNCLSRWDLVLKIKYSCEVSLSCLSCRLSHHLRTTAQALNVACVNHAVGHHNSGSGSGLFPDAYWQLQRAQLESSHLLASRVNALAVRTVVSPGAQQWLLAPGAGGCCWGGCAGTSCCLRSLCQLLWEMVTNTAVTCAVIEQAKFCFRLTHLTEVRSLDKRSLPPGYSWLARQVS